MNDVREQIDNIEEYIIVLLFWEGRKDIVNQHSVCRKFYFCIVIASGSYKNRVIIRQDNDPLPPPARCRIGIDFSAIDTIPILNYLTLKNN